MQSLCFVTAEITLENVCAVLWRMFSTVEDVHYCEGYHLYCLGYHQHIDLMVVGSVWGSAITNQHN